MSTANITSTAALAPVHVPAGEGPVLDLGLHKSHIKISSRHSAGTLFVFESAVEYQDGVPPHVHSREDESFYVLEGRFEFMAGGKTVQAGPGDTVFGPRNVPHYWRCISLAGGRVLTVVTPGTNFEEFAKEMSRCQANPAADMQNPETIAEFMALTAEHGMRMLPPAEYGWK